MLGTAFDDMPSDLEGLEDSDQTRLKKVVADMQGKGTITLYTEDCDKCRGTGRYNGHSTHGHHCFKCGGSGKLEFKTSPEYRKEARAKSAARKEKKAADERAKREAKAQAWNEANPEAAAWIAAGVKREFGFACDMAESVFKWGSLTSNQLAAVQRCIEKDKARAAEAAKRAETAPEVNATALHEAFAKAQASGLKWPRITLGEIVVSPASAESANAGALYVKEAGEYLGKVMNGKFLRVRACGEEQAKKIAELIANPREAAEAYGKLTGKCCLCHRQLTDAESVARGIGPVCAGRFFGA